MVGGFVQVADLDSNAVVSVDLDGAGDGYVLLAVFEGIVVAHTHEAGSALERQQNTDFRGADLQRVNFRQADLTEANLSEADLQRAEMFQAIMRRVNLRDSDLRNSDLRGADLTDADLTKARLRRAFGDQRTLIPANLTYEELMRRGMLFR